VKMKIFVALLLASLLTTANANAQLAPFNQAGVTMGHWHLVSKDVAATQKLFLAMGGTLYMPGGQPLIGFPGLYINLLLGTEKGEGGTVGSVVNHVGFIVLDTNSIIWDNTTYGNQAQWLPTAMMEVSGKDWLFVAGHHPYRSNGTHGNAGDYDAPELAGIPIPNPLPIQNGDNVKAFFDDHICGLGAQVYFSGHDHSRQWLDEAPRLCGTQMIVSGAGASTTAIQDRGNKMFYQDASEPGFMYIDIDGNTFTGSFYDRDGNMDFTRTFTK